MALFATARKRSKLWTLPVPSRQPSRKLTPASVATQIAFVRTEKQRLRDAADVTAPDPRVCSSR